ncbi:flagellin [Asticcacaulis sp.]|uniref:flagellin n=1 Tax=Asticcacaulis sp. TaxID=1872648 RepID=UPI00263751B5|nr:flagellin [Asticcacaulis sp.]
MALNSVNTNSGAMIALQNLNKTNADLQTTQTRINTGQKVASAKDNGAVFAIAQGQRAQVTSLNAVQESLSRNASVVDVAISAGESVSDMLSQLKEKALAASDSSLSTASRTALNEDFKAIRDQIGKTVNNATFNGINIIKQGGSALSALANDSGGTLTVAAQNLSLTGLGINATTIGTKATASAAVATLATKIDDVSAKLAKLGTSSKSLANHAGFISKLSDSIENGIGNLVDADLAKESAKLQALQTKQQLGVQALSIANQSTSTVLSLFR